MHNRFLLPLVRCMLLPSQVSLAMRVEPRIAQPSTRPWLFGVWSEPVATPSTRWVELLVKLCCCAESHGLIRVCFVLNACVEPPLSLNPSFALFTPLLLAYIFPAVARQLGSSIGSIAAMGMWLKGSE